MDRKANISSSDETLNFLVGSFFLIAVASAFTLTSSLIETQKTQDYNELERRFDAVRLFTAKQCFAYTDGRTYPGIIDSQKITDARINDCYQSTNGDPPAINAILYEDGEFSQNATTDTWTSTSGIVQRQRYAVSVDKDTMGVLEVYQK
jgi:hypothetical protein